MIDEGAIRLRWDAVGSQLDERGRRLFAAAEVRSGGRGSLAIVSKITGLACSTINRGKQDLDAQPLPKGALAVPAAVGARFARTISWARPGAQTSGGARDAGRSDAAGDPRQGRGKLLAGDFWFHRCGQSGRAIAHQDDLTQSCAPVTPAFG